MKKKVIIFSTIIAAVVLNGCSLVQQVPNGQKNPVEEANMGKLSDKELLNSIAFYQGVYINGFDVSGINKLVAEEKLKNEFEAKLNEEVVLKYNDKEFKYTLKDLGYTYDYKTAIKNAYEQARKGSDQERLKAIKDLKEKKVDIALPLLANEKTIEGKINELANSVNVKASKGTYKYNAENDKVVGINGKNGIEIDKDSLKASLKDLKDNRKVDIATKEIKMETSAEELAARVNGKIGSAGSNFNAGYWTRAKNIEVSTNALNGLVIGPGETFSFNSYLGDTTPDKGYQEAVIIENDEEVPGYGGGVCQTSTCFYQAALKSDLKVINRSPHTMIMPYAPGGLDAAIQYGSADLALKNPYDFPILIKTYHEPGYIQFDIYGDTNVKNYEVSLHSEFIKTLTPGQQYVQDSTLAPGSSVVKRPATKGSVYRAWKVNEATGEVTQLGETVYPAIDSIILTN